MVYSGIPLNPFFKVSSVKCLIVSRLSKTKSNLGTRDMAYYGNNYASSVTFHRSRTHMQKSPSRYPVQKKKKHIKINIKINIKITIEKGGVKTAGDRSDRY